MLHQRRKCWADAAQLLHKCSVPTEDTTSDLHEQSKSHAAANSTLAQSTTRNIKKRIYIQISRQCANRRLNI